MNSYVYIHPDVEQAATQSGDLARIEKLRDMIESTGDAPGFERWPSPYRRKSIGGNYRLLVELHELENAEAVVFRHFWTHARYDEFCARTLSDRQKYHDKHRTDKKEIDGYITRSQGSTRPEEQRLSPIDHNFLNAQPSQYDVLESNIILETHQWCKTMEEWREDKGNLLVKTMSISLHKSIERLLERIVSDSSPLSGQVQVENGEHMQVLYRYFQDWSILMLIDLMQRENSRTKKANLTKKVLREEYGADFKNRNSLMQRCRRAYPWLLAFDSDIWRDIQFTQKANMVLSSEECKVLQTLRSTDRNSPRYPLFINGRAGSGKSTILQFLFAGILDMFSQYREIGQPIEPPIYITYSRQLLDQAKEAVAEIRDCHFRKLERIPLSSEPSDASSSVQLDHCFNTVRELMRSLLSDSLRPKYRLDKCMTLGKFRTRWDRHRKRQTKGVRELSAGIVWHGIRTYIKGQSIVSPQEYSLLSNDRKSISDDMFTIIFEYGWPWYRQICATEELWDDQDLAHELLQCQDALARFPAIYCDEAQDFTSVELRLIQKLSRYSSYDFSTDSHLLRNIPFAFSGDPFQTLNPTGFRWGSIKAMYYEDLAHREGSMGTGKIMLNYHELSRNYRSVTDIIKLSNSIQLIRCLLTDDTSTKPQDSQDAPEGPTPQVYVLDNPEREVESRIRDSSDQFIIVPCDDGDEDDFIRGDEFLRGLVGEDDTNRDRIISPLRAKGLEWERVVVYRFGEHALHQCESLCDFLDNPNQHSMHVITEDQRFLAEYFLNKLYVAVTRPRTRLFLADSQRAVDSFWKFSKHPHIRQSLLKMRTSPKGWTLTDLGGFAEGDDEAWEMDRNSPVKFADQLERQGSSDGDVMLLESARYYFRIAGDQVGQDRCDAKISELGSDLERAASIFAKLNDWGSALRCRWGRGEWSKIVSAKETGVHIDESPEALTLIQAATILRGEELVRQELESVMELFCGDQRHIFVGQQVYADGLEKFFASLMERLVKLSFTSGSSWSGFPRALEDALGRLVVSERDVDLHLAHFYCNSGDWQSALRVWRKCNPGQEPGPKDEAWAVHAAQASMGPRGRLKGLLESGDYDGVADTWLAIASSDEVIESDVIQVVVQMARRSDKISAPVDALERVKGVDQWIRAIMSLGLEFDDAERVQLGPHIVVTLVDRLVLDRDWKRIAVLCDQNLRLQEPLHRLRRNWQWKRRHLLAVVSDCLARSFHRRRVGAEDRRAICKLFVKRHLWEKRTPKSQGRLPELRIVLKWLRRIHVIAVLVEAVCSDQEASDFYSELLLMLNDKNSTESDRRFARERFAFWVAKLPGHRAKLDEFVKRWEISVPKLSTVVQLPPVSDDYYAGLLGGHDVPREPVAVDPGESRAVEVLDDHEEVCPVLTQLDPSMSARTELEIRYEDRVLKGEISPVKRRVVLRDDKENQVLCGPDGVDSPDVAVESIEDGANSHWLIPSWGIRCLIDKRGGGRTIQFFLASGAILPGYAFGTPTGTGE